LFLPIRVMPLMPTRAGYAISPSGAVARSKLSALRKVYVVEAFAMLRYEEEEEHDEGSAFLAFSVKRSANMLGGSMLGDSSFLPPVLEEKKDERAKLWGNYRGSRYLIVREEGTIMTLSKTMTGASIDVSSCNVSDISTDSTTKEVICPGNNQCRRIGLRQGPRCTPIKPSEGVLHYPRPI